MGLVIFFNYYSDPMKGVSKQDVVMKKYLVEYEKYKKDEIIELERVSSDKKQLQVFAKIKEKYYIYFYKEEIVEKVEA